MTVTEVDTPNAVDVSEAVDTQDGGRQIVSFRLAQEEYGVDILHVQEIILLGQITRIPSVPDYVCGLINLRGHVIPVVDLRMRFGLPATELTEDARIIVLNVESRTIGIVVDAVDEVQRIRAEQIEPIGANMSGIGQRYVRSLIRFEDRILVLLHVSYIVDCNEAPVAGTA